MSTENDWEAYEYVGQFKSLTRRELIAKLEEVNDSLAREYDFDDEFGPEQLWELGIDLKNQRKALQALLWGYV